MQVEETKDFEKVVEFAKNAPALLITGPSGVGKDFIAEKLSKTSNLDLFALDAIGKREGSKWLVDTSAIESPKVYGTSDNLAEVGAKLAETGELWVIFIKPTATLFKQTTSAKLSSSKDKDLPVEWLKGWEDKVNMSPSEIAKYFKKKFDLLVAHVKPAKVLIYENDNPEGAKIVHGWHKKNDPTMTEVPHTTNEMRKNLSTWLSSEFKEYAAEKPGIEKAKELIDCVPSAPLTDEFFNLDATIKAYQKLIDAKDSLVLSVLSAWRGVTNNTSQLAAFKELYETVYVPEKATKKNRESMSWDEYLKKVQSLLNHFE